MANREPTDRPAADANARLRRKVAGKQQRKLRARGREAESIWFGLGTFGMVGWSVAVPTAVGAAVGYWIDHTWPSGHSWTLMLLVPGLAFGCFNAWHWIDRERRMIDTMDRENDEDDHGPDHPA